MRTLDDLPEVSLSTVNGADIDVYAALAELRAQTPLVRGPMGVTLALRYRHLEIITSGVTRQIETETKMLRASSRVRSSTSSPAPCCSPTAMCTCAGARRSPAPSPTS
jgi:hypothetical protein